MAVRTVTVQLHSACMSPLRRNRLAFAACLVDLAAYVTGKRVSAAQTAGSHLAKSLRYTMSSRSYIANVLIASAVVYRSICNLTEREKKHLLHEILQVRPLMPLLMKPRNQQCWTREDKQELIVHLRRLSRIGPYLIVLALPGSFLLLPALAWWLDRRRNRPDPVGTL